MAESNSKQENRKELKTWIAELKNINQVSKVYRPVDEHAFKKSLESTLDRFHQRPLIDRYNISESLVAVLYEIIEYVDPEQDLIQDENNEYLTRMEQVIKIYSITNNIHDCKEFVKEELQCSKEWLEEGWHIGDKLGCNYKDVQSFLMDIDWDLLCYIINRSWFDACQKETLNVDEISEEDSP